MAETGEPMSSDFRVKRLGIILFFALLMPLISTNIGERELSPQSIPSLSHDDEGWTGGAEKAIIDFDIDSLMKLQGVFIQFVDFAGNEHNYRFDPTGNGVSQTNATVLPAYSVDNVSEVVQMLAEHLDNLLLFSAEMVGDEAVKVISRASGDLPDAILETPSQGIELTILQGSEPLVVPDMIELFRFNVSNTQTEETNIVNGFHQTGGGGYVIHGSRGDVFDIEGCYQEQGETRYTYIMKLDNLGECTWLSMTSGWISGAHTHDNITAMLLNVGQGDTIGGVAYDPFTTLLITINEQGVWTSVVDIGIYGVEELFKFHEDSLYIGVRKEKELPSSLDTSLCETNNCGDVFNISSSSYSDWVVKIDFQGRVVWGSDISNDWGVEAGNSGPYAGNVVHTMVQRSSFNEYEQNPHYGGHSPFFIGENGELTILAHAENLGNGSTNEVKFPYIIRLNPIENQKEVVPLFGSQTEYELPSFREGTLGSYDSEEFYDKVQFFSPGWYHTECVIGLDEHFFTDTGRIGIDDYHPYLRPVSLNAEKMVLITKIRGINPGDGSPQECPSRIVEIDTITGDFTLSSHDEIADMVSPIGDVCFEGIYDGSTLIERPCEDNGAYSGYDIPKSLRSHFHSIQLGISNTISGGLARTDGIASIQGINGETCYVPGLDQQHYWSDGTISSDALEFACFDSDMNLVWSYSEPYPWDDDVEDLPGTNVHIWMSVDHSGNVIQLVETEKIGVEWEDYYDTIAIRKIVRPSNVDSDRDGVYDLHDSCPMTEIGAETDQSGCSWNQQDDDLDGFTNLVETQCNTIVNDADDTPVDSDGDGICDFQDPDDDNDGFDDFDDSFPLDSSEWLDTDGDGEGDNADEDDDGDGVPDWAVDTDEDGTYDHLDSFPFDPDEWSDSDGDGVGDNADAFPLDSSKSADSDGDGVGDDAENDLDGDGIPDVEEDSDEDGLSDDGYPSDENSTGGNEAQPASGESSETGIWGSLFVCCLLPLLLLFGPMLASSFRTGFTSTANLEVHRAKRGWPIWNKRLPDEAYEGKWAVVDKNGVLHSSHRRRRDAVEAMVTEESFSLQGGEIPALRAVDSEVPGESGLGHEADDARVDLADDAEELARLTGRKVEDVRADLADDGILNMSAGSDTKTKDEGAIDSSRFDKVRKLRAEGGMAEVYQGKDRRTGEQVIWKQAAPSRILSAKDANRALANEVEILERLDHPRIPDCIESGFVVNEEGDRVLVLIMEHIDGGSLDDEMKTFVRRGITQDLDYVIETVAQCCEALEYMADLDPPLYHRDIKPHNIMTHPERGVVLIDFGLAKEVAAGSGMSLSAGAHSAGWSPPERERAQTGSFTDVYSLGQLLWHMLTNEPAGIYSEAMRTETITEAGHPEWLADLVVRSTVPDDPYKRVQGVSEFRIRLENEGYLP